MSQELIQSRAALMDVSRQLARTPWVTLDTEFVRERTYYTRLCLVQLATPDLLVCIDPIAVDDIGPLLDALYDTGVTKVLHSARQDLEIFSDLRGAPPAPVFDTQLAAAYVGYDDQIGYAALVQAVTGVALDKAHTRTDWAARPLTPEQLRYAEDDVRYLRDVYDHLLTQLHALGRMEWLLEDCARLTDAALYRNDPGLAWQRIRTGQQLAPAGQQLLAELAAWRERSAQSRNLPRGWIVRDDVLLELARVAPTTAAELARVRGMDDRTARRWSADLLAVIAAGRQTEPRALWEHYVPLTAEQSRLCKRLMERLQQLAKANRLSPALLATRRDIERLVRGDTEIGLLKGWRRALAGEELLALLH